MRVALYARYSSENQKESSITDQFHNCEQGAMREGWTITARYGSSHFRRHRLRICPSPPATGGGIQSQKRLPTFYCRIFDASAKYRIKQPI
jgi:hypothetical protein